MVRIKRTALTLKHDDSDRAYKLATVVDGRLITVYTASRNLVDAIAVGFPSGIVRMPRFMRRLPCNHGSIAGWSTLWCKHGPGSYERSDVEAAVRLAVLIALELQTESPTDAEGAEDAEDVELEVQQSNPGEKVDIAGFVSAVRLIALTHSTFKMHMLIRSPFDRWGDSDRTDVREGVMDEAGTCEPDVRRIVDAVMLL